MTRQRRVILDELRGAAHHPTADAVYEAVRKRIPRISLATVYRNLEVLCERGLAARVACGDVRRRYDGRTRPHEHARCRRCGRIVDLPGARRDARAIRRVEQKTGFRISARRVEYVGLCSRCRRDDDTGTADE